MDLEKKIKNIKTFNSIPDEMIDFKSDEPYPPIKVMRENYSYARILLNDFSGIVSEFSAIAQYVNHQIRIGAINPQVAATIKGISMVEMSHLQMLGQVIVLLGCEPNYVAIKRNKVLNWTSKFVNYGASINNMIKLDIQSEKDAIIQYEKHLKKIDDPYIRDIIQRIILDEEKHIELFKGLL